MGSLERASSPTALASSARNISGSTLYGCEHLEELLSQGPKTVQASVDNYRKAQNTLGCKTKTISQTSRVLKTETDTPVITLRPTFLCLQCPTVYTSREEEEHRSSKKHMFALESSSGALYCHLCQDFIYDHRFEKLRTRKNYSSAPLNKKRKLNELYPTSEENRFVTKTSTSLPCGSGLPRGLYNMGQTCFMGVILQTVIHNPVIKSFFLGGGHITRSCTHEHCISCALDEAFADLCTTENVDGYAALKILVRSWHCDQALAGYQQQDAHEYFQFLLHQLHTTNCDREQVDSDRCQCTFHRAFYGRLQSKVTCWQCRNVSVAEDPILDLSLDLQAREKAPKVANPRAESRTDSQVVNLIGCLRTFTSREKLQPGSYNCTSPVCGGVSQRASKELGIKTLAPVLCMQLKKFEHTNASSGKLEAKLEFPLQLDMFPYTTRGKKHGRQCGDEVKIPQVWYDLQSVIVHKGKLDAGHYVCYCRKAENWFLFDDSMVTPAGEADVLGADAYLLFYIIRSLDGLAEHELPGANPSAE